MPDIPAQFNVRAARPGTRQDFRRFILRWKHSASSPARKHCRDGILVSIHVQSFQTVGTSRLVLDSIGDLLGDQVRRVRVVWCLLKPQVRITPWCADNDQGVIGSVIANSVGGGIQGVAENVRVASCDDFAGFSFAGPRRPLGQLQMFASHKHTARGSWKDIVRVERHIPILDRRVDRADVTVKLHLLGNGVNLQLTVKVDLNECYA